MNNFSDRVVERMHGRTTAGTIIELAIAEGQDLSDAAREAYLEMLDTTFGIGIKEIVPPELPTPMDDVEARRYAANERVPYFPDGASLIGNVSNYELNRWADTMPKLRQLKRYLMSGYAKTLARSETHADDTQ